jgi:hypothetical protein
MGIIVLAGKRAAFERSFGAIKGEAIYESVESKRVVRA